MIIVLLLAASSLHAQVVAPVLGRIASAPVVLPSVTASIPQAGARILPLPVSFALSPSPIPAAALPVSPAPAGVPAPESPLSSLDRAAQPVRAEPGATLNNFWDGLPLHPAGAQDLPALLLGFQAEAAGAARSHPAPWLSLPEGKHSRALDAAVELARGTVVGRRALAAAEKAVAAQGGFLSVDVLDLGRNYGEFDYLTGRLRLNRSLFAPGKEGTLAATLIHELIHVAQHAAGLPSYALELEIEAHLQDLELMSELGLAPPEHTFARQALDALARNPKAFVELLQSAVPGSPYLGESSLDDVIDQLEQDLDAVNARHGALAERLARAIENDLARLNTPEGAAAYRAFSRRVRALLERRAAEARR